MIYLKEGNFPLNFSYDDNIVQEKNSTYQLSFKFPTNNPLWESLTEETLLLADDLHREQEFIIFEVERHHGYITVYANQVATLLNSYSISELSVSEADGNRVMRSLVSSVIRPHNFTFYSDIATRHSLNLKNVTVATALFKDKHSILGQWGGDLVRDKYSIKLLANGGNNNEALFMYKKNLKTYQQKKSTKDLRTRIHFTKTINSQKEGEQDKVLSVTVDSPLINKYKNIYEGNLEVNDQDVVDEASLLNYAKQYYKNTLCDVLEESIEIDVIGVDTPVKMFDTVTIFHEKFNLDVKKKITKYTFSPMSKKLKTIGFGVFQQGLGSALSSMIDEAVTEKVETKVDAFKIQKNLAELLKKDRTAIEEKMKNLEEQSKAGVEVKKALFEKSGTVPEVTRTKILDAIEADIARLKTIITEAEMVKAIQARLDFAEIKTALIDKAFVDDIISNKTFKQQFEAGEVTTQNIFTKMRDSIQSSINKEFITKEETKKLVNDLTIGADGVRQITQEETNKIIDNRKNELKGDSSYIHKKYSNNANGTPMTDDVNSKYMGIYTGSAKTPPANASEYNWIKIKFEERLVKGYANSKTGLDFTTVEPFEESTLVAKNRPRVRITNNNDISDIWQANDEVFLKPDRYYYISIRAKGNANGLHIYIKDYNNNSLIWENLTFGNELQIKSTTFVTPKNMSNNNVWLKFAMQPEDANWEGVEVDWWTIQEYGGHDNFRDFPLNTPAQYHKFRYFGYANITDGNPTADKFEWFDLQQKSMQTDKYTHLVYSDNADGTDFGKVPKKYMGIARTTSPVTPTNKEEFKWFKITGEDGKKGEDGHSLNAYLRLEGSYLNSNIANFGAYVKVMYDGVQISNFDISHSYRGASFPEVSNQASAVASNGLITNMVLNADKTDGTPLYVDITVKYKGLTSVASARLDNTVDVELVNNTINKFKTFESTLENFESTIKEIDKKKFKMSYNIENLCSETQAEKKGNDLYFNTKRPLEANKYYYILAYLKNAPEGRFARIYYAENNGDNKSITNGLNIWRIKYTSQQTRVNIFSQGSETTVKNVEIYEVPEVPFPEGDVLATVENNDISYFNLRFKRKIKPNEILKLTFNVKGRPTMDYSYYCENAVLSVRPLVEGENICIFRVKEETDLIQFSYRGNGISGQKSDFKCVKIVFDKGYKNEYNISDMESSIKQTKSTIDLSVKKNEVINSINLSGEGVKINADKVDISGTLSAYTGLIGGFRIGNNPNDGGYWLTGMNNFDCGINPGHNVGTRGIQLWAAWGNNWTNPSDRAWWVNAQGEMHCKGTSYFTGNSNFESTTFNQTPQMKKGLYVNGNIQVTGNIYYNNGGENSGYWIYSTYYKSIAPNSSRTYVYLTYSGGGSDWIPLNKEISDRRFKRDIQPSTINGLEIINNLKTYSYTKEYDGKTEDIECGIMAQDVKEHAKSAFQEAPEEVQTYSTFKLVPYLIKAVQELSEKVENLEKQLKERSKKDGI